MSGTASHTFTVELPVHLGLEVVDLAMGVINLSMTLCSHAKPKGSWLTYVGDTLRGQQIVEALRHTRGPPYIQQEEVTRGMGYPIMKDSEWGMAITAAASQSLGDVNWEKGDLYGGMLGSWV